MDIENEAIIYNINSNKIYQQLESNSLIVYPKNSNNILKKNFELNSTEIECFTIILNILKKYNLNTTCRIAGGWVRDKLLGKESDDIDIALNDMKGSKLASLINEELYPGKDKVGIIQQNAKKGKHLETATIKICKVWIDFVNLRCENDNEIGTPLSDAELRDLSINSLFYNINEKKVEDFTNKGIKDLENGIIETPIKAEITFKHDPLRILRMLRFAIKYKFKIGDDINNCIEKNKEEYLEQFYNNISAERIEKELYKILNMENSAYAIAYLYSYNLLDIIFLIKKFDSKYNFDNIFIKIVNLYILGEYLYEKIKIFNSEITSDNFSKIDYSLLLLTLYFRQFKIGKKDTMNTLILKNTYKTGNEYIKQNKIMAQYFDELTSLINSQTYERLPIGKLLRKLLYKNIIPSLLASIAYEYIEKMNLNSIIDNINENILNNIIEKNKKFYDFIKNENMMHIDEMKPLFSGQDIMQILNIKPGSEIGILVECLIEEQIKKDNYSKDEAKEFLINKKEELANKNPNNKKKKNKNK